MKRIGATYLRILAVMLILAVLVLPGVQISWQNGLQVRFETPNVYAIGSNVTNDLTGNLSVFSQDYTAMSAVPSNMCLAEEIPPGNTENETLSYNGTSHCVSLDVTEHPLGKLFVGGLSPSLSTSLTLDMGMGRTNDWATLNVFAGGAYLTIRLVNGTPTDTLRITSYYYNPTLLLANSDTANVGFSGGGRFRITILSNTLSKTNTIYLNDVEKLTTPLYKADPLYSPTVYDPFVNPFICFNFDSIFAGETAHLQLYSIEQTVPEYSYITPISNPRLTSFGIDGPYAWDTVGTGLSLLDHGTIWADTRYVDDYSPSELAALKALIADGWELGIHFPTGLSTLALADAITLMNTETDGIAAVFGKSPTSFCSNANADNTTHADYAYTNLGLVWRNGWNGDGGGLSTIGNLDDTTWNFWSSMSAAGVVIPSFTHELDITPAVNYSVSPGNFSSFLSNCVSRSVKIVGFREYWEIAQNSCHTVISNVLSDPGVSLSFTIIANVGGKSRLFVNAPWANVVRDSSGDNVPYEVSGSGIVVEAGVGEYFVSNEGSTTNTDVTPPTRPVVSDDGESTTDLTQLHASWSSSDAESGVIEYSYAIGTTSGGTNVVNWTSVKNASTSVTKIGLNLTVGKTYYFSVKAKNGKGLWSNVGTSDGIMVVAQEPEEPTSRGGGGMPVWAWVIIVAVVGGVGYLAFTRLAKKR